MINDKLRPIIRWAGGKTWLTKSINDFVPTSFNNYHEPFLGSAAIFLHLKPKKTCYLSDANKELINFYLQVRDNLKELVKEVNKLENNEEAYYQIRSWSPISLIHSAARFYYLNKTCFNGLYRVNKQGVFNVPYGFRDEKHIIDSNKFEEIRCVLKDGVYIKHQDFSESLKAVKKNDLVFLDPPYTVAHNNNGFVEYNQNIFSWRDQERLAELILMIKAKGAYFILTNAVHESIIKLYGKIGKRFEIERSSTISGHMKDRKRVSEFIITNCV